MYLSRLLNQGRARPSKPFLPHSRPLFWGTEPWQPPCSVSFSTRWCCSYHCCFSVSESCLTLCNPMDYSTPGSSDLSVSWSLPKLMSIELVMPLNYLILCCPPFLLPSILSSIRGFSSELSLHIRWPNYWSSHFSISPSNEYSGFISFRIDWLDLLAVQGTLKRLLQHHSSKASVLQHSALFRAQLSYLYMTTGKIIALIRQTFVSKVMSLVFNMLSRFVIAFLPRRKCLLTLILILI